MNAFRYAVVFKTYVWDDFVERQARRCSASTGTGDFYILADETNGPVNAIGFERVVRTSNSDLITSGLANRFEKGSLLWWNADYPHYIFCKLQPNYDFYVFVEYDALYIGDYDRLIQRLAFCKVDLAVQPLDVPKGVWNWTLPHLRTYPQEELDGCLMCISVFSRQAVALLGRRRIEMADDPGVAFWPSAEVFLPTEAKRAGLKCVSLSNFGDTSKLKWRPAQLEAAIILTSESAFVHPVYDQPRFIRWALAQGVTPRNYLNVDGPVLPHLRQLSLRAYLPALLAAFGAGILTSIRSRTRNLFSIVTTA